VVGDEDLLTADEVAEMLGVPAGSIHLLVAREAIPFVKQGRWWKAASYRFRRSEIDEWLRSDPYYSPPSGEGAEELGEDR
jgi:excisionase family DNA binding protein